MELGARRLSALGIATAVLAATIALLVARPSAAQITWLNFEDGDVLNVSKAHGLLPGHLRIDAGRGLEESQGHGKILHHHLLFQYGLTRRVTLGASGRHLQQRNGDLFKDGLGDSNVFLKVHWQPEGRPYSFGLRQSVSLPTGYELEREGLQPFTTRHNDFATQALLSYETDRLGIHLNPGIILTGSDNPTYLTGGAALELERVLPLGVSVAGEYFTRWNMVEEEFETDVFLRFDRPLFWGLALDAGVKRRLLESASTRAEWRFGLSFGRVHDRHAGERYLPPPRFAPVRLHVDPIRTEIPDPLGMRELMWDELWSFGQTQAHGVPVLVRPGEGPAPERARGDDRASGGAEGTGGESGYRLQISLLQVEDGRIGGYRVPLLFQAPRAEAEMHVMVRLLDADGLPLGREVVFDAQASRGLGAQIAPLSSSFEQKVVPDEVRGALRQELAERLVRDIVQTNADVIGRRESQ